MVLFQDPGTFGSPINQQVEGMLNSSLQGPSGNQVAMDLNAPANNSALINDLATAGLVMGIGSAVTSAIGGYYQAKSARYQLKSQESSLRFQSDMSRINARLAENQAQQILEGSRQQMSMAALAYTQQQSATRTSQGARGIQGGQGSAQAVAVSQEYLKKRALYTMDVNAARQAGAARMQRANIEAQGSMLAVQAGNVSAMRAGINPARAAGVTLLGSSGQLLNQSAEMLRWRDYNGYA